MNMAQAEKKVEWCVKKAEKEGHKHKGVRIVEPNQTKVQEHLAKARRNLRLIDHLLKIEYPDWAISAIFYSMYHGLLAILWRYGYESRNQACTFAVIEKLIAESKIPITIDELRSIQESGDGQDETVVDLREYYQYGTETQVEKGKVIFLQQQAKEFVAKVSTLLEEGNKEQT